jgi:hypothetical protein
MFSPPSKTSCPASRSSLVQCAAMILAALPCARATAGLLRLLVRPLLLASPFCHFFFVLLFWPRGAAHTTMH